MMSLFIYLCLFVTSKATFAFTFFFYETGFFYGQNQMTSTVNLHVGFLVGTTLTCVNTIIIHSATVLSLGDWQQTLHISFHTLPLIFYVVILKYKWNDVYCRCFK